MKGAHDVTVFADVYTAILHCQRAFHCMSTGYEDTKGGIVGSRHGLPQGPKRISEGCLPAASLRPPISGADGTNLRYKIIALLQRGVARDARNLLSVFHQLANLST
jgi:hypothetical protein